MTATVAVDRIAEAVRRRKVRCYVAAVLLVSILVQVAVVWAR